MGLGDLGVHGMGIPVGKAVVYGACGVNPDWILPITLDVGTNNTALLKDPLYLGLPVSRERGDKYMALVDELVAALQKRYGPLVLIHWEDLGPSSAFSLLQRLQSLQVPTFNDDVQCTAAVVVAAVLGAMQVPGVVPLKRQKFLFFGAGQASLGTARLLVQLMQAVGGMTVEEARSRIWMMDSKGLVEKGRGDLSAEKAQYAQEANQKLKNLGRRLVDVIKYVQPTTLIGAAGVGKAFNQQVIEALCKTLDRVEGPSSRPLVLALSNPDTKEECTYEEATRWSEGRVVYASGSPFPPLKVPEGSTRVPAQANNCYVFPGLALGCVSTGAMKVTEGMLLAAAMAVADLVSPEELAAESVLPHTSRLLEVTTRVAAMVALQARKDKVSSVTIDSTQCLAALQKAEKELVATENTSVPKGVLEAIRKLQYLPA